VSVKVVCDTVGVECEHRGPRKGAKEPFACKKPYGQECGYDVKAVKKEGAL